MKKYITQQQHKTSCVTTAVINALKIKALQIGPQIDPGVPWTISEEPTPKALALKSGNFGTPNFFLNAFSQLDSL